MKRFQQVLAGQHHVATNHEKEKPTMTTTEPTVALTIKQADILYDLVTLIEDRTPETQEAVLVLARFLDEHSGYPDDCIDPCPYVHHKGECTRQPSGPAVAHADRSWTEGRYETRSIGELVPDDEGWVRVPTSNAPADATPPFVPATPEEAADLVDYYEAR